MKKYKLGDICEIVSGSTPKTNIAEFWDGDVKWITPAELDENTYIITDSVRKITNLAMQKTGLTAFPAGTVILSSRAPIGKVAIAGCKMCCNQGFKNFICSEIVNNKYLYWFLKHNTAYLNSLGRGATFKEISKSIVSSIEIDLPSLEEQKRVVDNIEKISTIITLRKKEISILDDLIKARFGDPVSNPYKLPTVLLGELSELITKGASPSWQGFNYTDDPSQTLFLTSENVKNGYIDLSSPKYIEDKFNTKQKRSIVHKGVFLINIVGASIGRAAQFNLNCKANMNQAAALVRINDNRIRDKYLLTYLNSDKAQLMYDSMKSDTGRANLSLKDISELSILLPSIEEQLIFEKVVAQIDKSKLLSGCRLFHSWAPEIEKSESCWRAPTEDKGFAGMSTPTMTLAGLENLNHVGAPRRRTKALWGGQRQQ